MDNKGNQNKNGKNPRGQNYAVLIMTMLFTLLCVAMMHNLWQGSRTHKMPYSEFNQMLKDHEVESVVIGNGKIQITPKEDSKKYGGSQGKYGNLVGMEYYTIPINDPDLEKKLDEAGVTTYEQAEVDATGSIIMLLLEWVLPIAAMFVIFNMMMKRMGGGGGIMGVGKSNAKVYVQKETGVTFKDVAGEDEAKESLTEIVDFLHNKAEKLRKMKAEYENFVLAYHRGGIDEFRKYSNYALTRPFWNLVYNYHFPTTNTASKNKFLQQAVEPYLDLVWRQWNSPKLQSKFDEVKEKAVKAQALKQEREESLAAMPSYLEGLASDQYLAFHEQVLRILNRDKKKLSESSGILKVDIEHRYQPLLKLLKGTRDIEDSLDAKIRQGIDSIFLSICQVLWDYMLYPYDLDYIIENKKVVKKVLDEIWKLKR